MAKQSFEDRLDKVKGIIDGIETGEMPLEESVRQFESGMKELGELEKELEGMKRRITQLQENPDGTAAEVPMEEMDHEE